MSFATTAKNVDINKLNPFHNKSFYNSKLFKIFPFKILTNKY